MEFFNQKLNTTQHYFNIYYKFQNTQTNSELLYEVKFLRAPLTEWFSEWLKKIVADEGGFNGRARYTFEKFFIEEMFRHDREGTYFIFLNYLDVFIKQVKDHKGVLWITYNKHFLDCENSTCDLPLVLSLNELFLKHRKTLETRLAEIWENEHNEPLMEIDFD